VTAVGIAFGELDQDQSKKSTIFSSRDTLADTTTVPPTIYRSHIGRDSSYNAGPRAGFNGSATWKPMTWLETRGMAILTRASTTAFIRNIDFWELEPNVGATKVITSDTSLVIPNGDDQYEARAKVSAIPKGLAEIVVRAHNTDQPYYDPSQRALEHLTLTNRNGTFHLEQSPFRGAQFTLDGTLSHLLKEYTLQKRYTGETNTQSVSANFGTYRPYDRYGLGFQVSNARNDRQFNGNGNGNVISRALNASATHRVTNRLWLDTNTSISLFSLLYDGTGNIADQDNVKAFVYAGGGYRVASTCSTTVHLSLNRNHKVAISESASGQNNVTTNYQVEGTLNLQATPTLLILQNYRLSANYLIYDYDEPHNTLTRLRTVDTVIQESLFTFASVKLTHNFFFQDHGTYSRSSPEEARSYALDQQLYQQNLGVSFALRPSQGIVFYATQSLSNTRTYFFNGFPNTIRNRWGLNYGVNIDRDLPGAMSLHGNIQHVGEYTELPDDLPAQDKVNYWLAGVTFSKDF